MLYNKGIFLYTIKTSEDGISNLQIICTIKVSEDEKLLTEESTLIAKLRSDEYIKYYGKSSMNKLQQEQYNIILEIAIDRNYKVISNRYENRDSKMIFLCSNGHLRNITSRSFKDNTRCLPCNNNCPILSEKNFRSNIKKLDAKVIGSYINCSTKIECLCKNGHTYHCTPASVRLGMGNCLRCKDWTVIKIKKRTPEKIYQDFIDDVTKLGGKVIGKYVSSNEKIECMCAKGHQCFIKYAWVRVRKGKEKGKGMCVKCGDRCPVQASQKFHDNIIKSKGKVIGKYDGCGVAVECICPNGHTCYPVPDRFKQSGNMCSLCSGCSIVVAEQNFKDLVTSQGGILMGEYINQYERIKCICSLGHICHPIPKTARKSALFCYTCNKTNGSHGEKLICEVLENLGVTFYKEKRHPLIPKLRFDFYFEYGDIMYYIEYDGKQHFFNNKFFYKRRTFDDARQTDLMKNYIINLDTNSKLIRFDYKWNQSINSSNKQKIIDKMLIYLKECISKQGKIFANGDLYEWKNTQPTEETINKYYNTNKLNITINNEIFDDFSDDDFSDDDFSDDDRQQ